MIKEISRRCATSNFEGMACGPFSLYGAQAEMEIEDDGNRLFLNAEWADMVADEVALEVTKESIFDLLLSSENVSDEIDRIRSEAPEDKDEYQPYYEELIALLKKVILEDGVYSPYEQYKGYSEEELEEEGIDLNDDKSVWGF